MNSLVPRSSTPPDFDHLQYVRKNAVSDQKPVVYSNTDGVEGLGKRIYACSTL